MTMLRYGLLVQLAAVLTLITYRLSYYMIESYQGRAGVGVFSVGVSLSEAIWLVANSFGLILFTKVANSKDRKFSQEMSIRFARLSLAATFFVLLPLVFCPSSLFQLIFGEGFGTVHRVVLWLSPGILFYCLNIVLNNYFSGTGQYRICTAGAAIGFVVILIFNFLLIPTYGIEGAGIASSLAYFSMGLFQVIVFNKQSGFRFIDFIIGREDIIRAIEEIRK